MSSRGEIKKSPLSSRGGLIKVRDNKRQEGSSGTRERGKNGRKQNERLKTPPSRYNGILSRHLRLFFLPLPLSSRFAVIRPIARKQIRLQAEDINFTAFSPNYP